MKSCAFQNSYEKFAYVKNLGFSPFLNSYKHNKRRSDQSVLYCIKLPVFVVYLTGFEPAAFRVGV